MQGLGAVVAAADAHSRRIQQGGDVVGVQALHAERRQRGPVGLLLRGGPQDPHAVDGLQPLEQAPGELLLPGMDALHAQVLQVIEGGAHADRLTDGRRAGFELVGQVGPGAVVQVDVVDHLAAPQERRHRLQQRLVGPEEAHARRAAQLVGRTHQEIGPQGGHVHRLVGQALAGIHQQQGAGPMGQRGHRLDRIEAAQGVAHVHQAHQPGAVAELGLEILQIQFAALGDARMAQNAARASRQQLPGHQIAVVLHHRQQHLIALPQVGFAPGAGHQVDRLAGIAGEDDLPGAGGADEGGHLAAGRLEVVGGAGAQLVGAAVHVGVVVAVVLLQRLQHLTRLLAGGGVIQVDQRLPQAGRLGQQGEIGARLRRQVDHRRRTGQGRRRDHRRVGGGRCHRPCSPSRLARGCHGRAASGSSCSTSSQKPRNSSRAAWSAEMPRLCR